MHPYQHPLLTNSQLLSLLLWTPLFSGYIYLEIWLKYTLKCTKLHHFFKIFRGSMPPPLSKSRLSPLNVYALCKKILHTAMLLHFLRFKYFKDVQLHNKPPPPQVGRAIMENTKPPRRGMSATPSGKSWRHHQQFKVTFHIWSTLLGCYRVNRN